MFRTGKAGPIALAVLLCAIHFASFDVSTQPIVTDVRYFLYYAWRVAEGAIPHLDFFENKPQLSTFAGALRRPTVCSPTRVNLLFSIGAWRMRPRTRDIDSSPKAAWANGTTSTASSQA